MDTLRVINLLVDYLLELIEFYVTIFLAQWPAIQSFKNEDKFEIYQWFWTTVYLLIKF